MWISKVRIGQLAYHNRSPERLEAFAVKVSITETGNFVLISISNNICRFYLLTKKMVVLMFGNCDNYQEKPGFFMKKSL